ncbi:9887_t:CDS:2 [Acaulospora colombiana]|uniref:9887_t:CDS:1 n=1 Tax=Acaulospora colombiana TaxID=27376 RepID=A0ACA9MA65_9GLOM|nr:9887_t:CDS:2 [Acaulospora colombiana]
MHSTRSKQWPTRAKEKPRQTDRVISPESIFHWLKNDLGYRHKRNLFNDLPEKELSIEEIQKNLSQPTKSHQTRRHKETPNEVNYVTHKAILDKKMAQIMTIFEEEEIQTEQLISRISDIGRLKALKMSTGDAVKASLGKKDLRTT